MHEDPEPHNEPLVPADAMHCPTGCGQVMIPWKWWYECPRCMEECLAPV